MIGLSDVCARGEGGVRVCMCMCVFVAARLTLCHTTNTAPIRQGERTEGGEHEHAHAASNVSLRGGSSAEATK